MLDVNIGASVGMMVGIFPFSNVFSTLYLRKSVLWALAVCFLPRGLSESRKNKHKMPSSHGFLSSAVFCCKGKDSSLCLGTK